jgi:hypothetical protein
MFPRSKGTRKKGNKAKLEGKLTQSALISVAAGANGTRFEAHLVRDL